ncbi:hypothetical protein ACQEVS_01565 [Streptomyces sp. CA-181903]|uniref:hypothetical protein n=1 Tax=Streptomyces sp. CA-181903 TaxID=3240055 RepID=UPI003D94BC57
MIGTPDPRAGTDGPLRRLLRAPGAPEALRRATWLTVAGCAGFYTFAYAFGRRDMALFAMFGALPLILFSSVPGPPPRRTGTLLLTLPVGWALVTAGTLLAVRDWSAALGMLVVGFAVSLLANGGPRTAGPAPAFQLYYVLPCFPPYAPDALPARLAGLTVGILLTALVDRLLWRDPPTVPYRTPLAAAAEATAGYCAAVGRLLAGDDGAEDVRDAREAAHRALTATLLSQVPPAERPTTATPGDRALAHTRAAVRHVRDLLDGVVDDPGGPVPGAPGLLRHCAESLRRTASSLRADVRDPGARTPYRPCWPPSTRSGPGGSPRPRPDGCAGTPWSAGWRKGPSWRPRRGASRPAGGSPPPGTTPAPPSRTPASAPPRGGGTGWPYA